MKEELLNYIIRLQDLDFDIALIKKEISLLSKGKIDDREKKSLEAVLKRYLKEREEIAAKLPPDLLSRIARLQMHYDGSVVAQVVEEICLGCRVRVPTTLITTLQKGDQLVYCENCGRILQLSEPKLYISKSSQEQKVTKRKRGRKPKYRYL